VINVTLTFADVNELMTFFTSIQAPASGVKVQPSAVEVGPSAPKPKKSTPAPVEPAAPSQPTAAPTEAPAPAAAVVEPEPEAAPGVAYADLQKAVLALYKIDRAKAAAIATSMGYESFKVMPADRWAEALDLVNANLKG
jgi:cell division septation protein DedD